MTSSSPRIRCRIGLLCCFAVMHGCSGSSTKPDPKPAPPAKPVIVNKKLETYWFADSKLTVGLRNDGKDGWVVVFYKTTRTNTSWEVKRRSGATNPGP